MPTQEIGIRFSGEEKLGTIWTGPIFPLATGEPMSTPALTPSAFGYTPVRTRQIWYAVAILLTAGIGPFLLWAPLASLSLRISCPISIVTWENQHWCGRT